MACQLPSLIYTMNILLTHSHRSTNRATEILPTLPSTHSMPPGTTAFSMLPETNAFSTPAETGVDLHGVAIPYDVDTHEPELISSRQSHNAAGVFLNLLPFVGLILIV